MLQNPIRRVATLVLVAAMAALLVPALVLAHAELETPTPADKSTVTTPVTEVSGTFIQRMKVDGSTLVVKLVGGGTVAEGGVDPADDKRMVATPTLAAGVGFIPGRMDDELGRGQRGRARHMDLHRGGTASPSPTPAVTAAASAVPTAAVSAAPSAIASLDRPDPRALGRWQLHGERQ